MAPSTDDESNNVVEKLRVWYGSLSPVKLDIIGDLAGKELFGIHGDSLLSYCITEAHADFHHGFQLLHAVHAVESFLQKLQEHGCHFHIVWFDDHEHLSVPRDCQEQFRDKYRLARTVVAQHLRIATDAQSTRPTLSFPFPSMHSAKFAEYLEHHPMRFFMCRDGREYKPNHPGQVDLRSMMAKFNNLGYTVVLFDDLEFSSSKMYTSIIYPNSRAVALPQNGSGQKDSTTSVPQAAEEFSLLTLMEVLPPKGQPWSDEGGRPAFSARHLITLAYVNFVLQQDSSASAKERCTALLLHLVVLRHWPLAHRAAKLPSKISGTAENANHAFLASFASFAVNIVKSWLDWRWSEAQWDVYDLVDGRLFHNVYSKLTSAILDDATRGELGELFGQVKTLTSVDLSPYLGQRVALVSLNDSPPPSATWPKSRTPRLSGGTGDYRVLPFTHPVLDKHLTDIDTCIDKESDAPINEEAVQSKVFAEVSHWHNAKKSLDSNKRPTAPPSFWVMKKNQRFMADTIAYSASLTNAAGKNIEPEIIVVSTASKDKTAKAQPEWKAALKQKDASVNAKKNSAPSGKEKAMQAAQAKKATELDKKSAIVLANWRERCRGFEKDPELARRYLAVTKYISSLSAVDWSIASPEALLYQCDVLARLRVSAKLGPEILALIWNTLLELSKLPTVSKPVLDGFEKLAKALRFPPTKAPALSPAPSRPLEALPFKPLLDQNPNLGMSMDPREFQLMHCGPYLERSFDSTPDPRVPFHPDAWQRRVLDGIDADKSLFVVAPTSAGKTFISFYAMKKVLQANEDDVLVYVAPTKALVNQIAAEVQARFSKSYQYEGRSVWAIHTRDYRVNSPTGCQVLVTVPAILQIMLLSPSNAQKPNSWSRRVKRIIFDEVHCIGQSEDGIVWEQLLLLAPCPIIALSATVGNPNEFKEWLQGTQKAKGFDLDMIVHNSRYSDLRKFLYQPDAVEEFPGLDYQQRILTPGLNQNSAAAHRFTTIHPISAVIDLNQVSLDDVTLEAKDCFELWSSMKKHSSPGFELSADLAPSKALPELIKKADIVAWETALKKQLQGWKDKPNSPFLAVRNDLRGALAKMLEEDEDVQKQKPGRQDQFGTALTLLKDLLDSGGLPAILFNFDRSECEETAKAVLNQLVKAEAKWKETSPEWAKTMKKFRKWQSDTAAAAAAKARKVPAKGKKNDEASGSKADLERDQAEQEWGVWDSFDPDMPVQPFSFADPTKITREELDAKIASLTRIEIRQPIIDALRRGIGVHHAGMNRYYRQVVEMWFRRGFLTVIIATGTLALGINMPCKTTVFAGDSVFLTALNYRQASGRAGRRGFDLLGNVVFHSIRPQRVLEILSSSLPDLRGQFPVSTTLVLRILILLHQTQNSEYAIKAAESLLSQTRCFLGGPAAEMSIKHHVRFSIEFLRRQHMLSDTGKPLNFSGLVSHLFFTENAVFAFHSLLKSGYFHELCKDVDISKPLPEPVGWVKPVKGPNLATAKPVNEFDSNPAKPIILELLLVLCHIFSREPVWRWQDEQWLQETVHRSSSLVLLPPLPRAAHAILKQHNEETLSIFRGYVETYVDQNLGGVPDRELPFTKTKVGPEQRELHAYVFEPAPPTLIRSPFAALSGFTDTFGSIHELCSTIRSGVFLEESAVPYLTTYPDETNGRPWNAYLLDFFKHGDMATLVRDNGIRSGDVWFRLKDFSLVLATIVASLENFVNPDADAAMADVQDAEDRYNESLDVKAAADGAAANGAKTAAAAAVDEKPVAGAGGLPLHLAKSGKKKKAAVDSWEDEAGSDDNDDDSSTVKTCKRSQLDGSSSTAADWDTASTAASSAAATPAWTEEGCDVGLLKVLRAFTILQREFEEKFRKEWA